MPSSFSAPLFGIPLAKRASDHLPLVVDFHLSQEMLTNHAHSDHVAGHALVKELTGAKIYVMQGDEQVIEKGGAGQYLYDHKWKPAKVDKVLKDGDKVRAKQ